VALGLVSQYVPAAICATIVLLMACGLVNLHLEILPFHSPVENMVRGGIYSCIAWTALARHVHHQDRRSPPRRLTPRPLQMTQSCKDMHIREDFGPKVTCSSYRRSIIVSAVVGQKAIAGPSSDLVVLQWVLIGVIPFAAAFGVRAVQARLSLPIRIIAHAQPGTRAMCIICVRSTPVK
jgi:hypothetical protein